MYISFSLWHRNARHHKRQEEKRGNVGALRCCVSPIGGVEKWLLLFFHSHLIFPLLSLFFASFARLCHIFLLAISFLPFLLHYYPPLSCLLPSSVLSYHRFSLTSPLSTSFSLPPPILPSSLLLPPSFDPFLSPFSRYQFLRGDRRGKDYGGRGRGRGECYGNHRWFFYDDLVI